MLPYYALASGFLAGKYRSASDHAGAARQPGATRYLTPTGLAVLAALDSVAAATASSPPPSRSPGCSPGPASSRRWPRPHRGPAAPLLAAATLNLTADEVHALDDASVEA